MLRAIQRLPSHASRCIATCSMVRRSCDRISSSCRMMYEKRNIRLPSHLFPATSYQLVPHPQRGKLRQSQECTGSPSDTSCPSCISRPQESPNGQDDHMCATSAVALCNTRCNEVQDSSLDQSIKHILLARMGETSCTLRSIYHMLIVHILRGI